jgi:hypothetical protein
MIERKLCGDLNILYMYSRYRDLRLIIGSLQKVCCRWGLKQGNRHKPFDGSVTG